MSPSAFVAIAPLSSLSSSNLHSHHPMVYCHRSRHCVLRHCFSARDGVKHVKCVSVRIVIHSLSQGVSFQVQLQVVIQVLQPSRCSYRLSSSFLFAILFSCSRPGKSESAGRGRGSRRNKPQHFGDFISPGGGGAGGRNRELDSRKDMRPNYNSNNIASNNNNNRIVNAVHRATYNQVR